MTYALIIIAVVIAAALIYLASLDGSFAVRRSLAVAADRGVVFDKIRDFRSWRDWSPWLMHEPDTRLEYSDAPNQEGGWYSWDGSVVGAGRITHVRFDNQAGIEQRIEFVRPFKSESRVWWELETQDDGSTMVHWNMAGKMPFLFRFMARKVPEYIGKDYDTGLYMLRAELEQDAEVPRISFDGPGRLDEVTALAIAFEGHLDEMKVAMEQGFPALANHLEESGIVQTGRPFTIYHSIDPAKMHFVCDMAVPVAPGSRSENYTVKTWPGGNYYKVTLRGSYEFLELAWYQAYSHLQMTKIKPRRGMPSREVYENDPGAVAHSNEIRTSIYIPIK